MRTCSRIKKYLLESKSKSKSDWFDSSQKLKNQKIPPYEAFFSKLRNNNALDKDFKGYQNLGASQPDEQQDLKKVQLESVPASGWNYYKYL